MQKLSTILLIMLSTISFAQEKEKEKKKDISRDLKYPRNLSLFADFGYNTGITAMPISATLFFTGQHLDFQAEQSLSNILKINSDTAKLYGIKPLNSTELTLSYHFAKKEKTVTKVFVISSWTSGMYTYTQYGAEGHSTLREFSVRGGTEFFNSSMRLAEIGNRDQYVNYQTGILFAGLSSKRIFNDEKVKYMRDLYFDVLFPTSTSVGQTMLPLSTGANSKAVKNASGWRIGWNIHSSRIFGFYFRVETGSMPGYQFRADTASKSVFDSMYTMFSLGLGFSSGALKYVPI
jgi:hypothetical protein